MGQSLKIRGWLHHLEGHPETVIAFLLAGEAARDIQGETEGPGIAQLNHSTGPSSMMAVPGIAPIVER